ncbi:MAG: hypothetical protein M0Z79_13570 [Nitrospiraceae bacterium]|nr:hypothetical protein [Nitrospiraceae bacterium]
MFTKRHIKDFIKTPAHILYHVILIAVSAGFALSLPYTADFLAKKFLVYWTLIGNEKVFLVAVELALAVFLILFFNYAGRSWKDRKYARMAKEAGLVFVSPATGFFSKRRSRSLKESQGIARDVMLIGSTGFRTFADAKGDLHNVIRNCREARIMLLNPDSEGASIRAKSILDPDITVERFRVQVTRSIEFLKELKAVQRNVKLKLYNEIPLLKLVISGDYIWMKHYHAGLDVQSLPEFVFKHRQSPGSLYMPFYQYFLTLWNNPGIPEYDLETDELIYRDSAGNEERREPFQALEPSGVA